MLPIVERRSVGAARRHTWTITGADVFTPTGWVRQDVHVVDGKLAPVAATGAEVIDAGGLRLVPGFIDLQINGGWGIDLQTNPDGVWELAHCLAQVGVTTFLPTLTSNGHHLLPEASYAWAAGPADPDYFVGADPVGWHLEGPWLAPSRHGAHSRELLQPVPLMLPAHYSPENGILLVTLAPELADALPVITELARRGVVVSCGHSEADGVQTRSAFEAGARMGTHLFNSMSGLGHRNVGLAAALLLEESAYVSLIVDGSHVDPDMVDLAWRLARGRVIIVSDSVDPGADGIVGADGAVRQPNGTLTGTVLGLDAALRNLMKFTDCDLVEALGAVTEVPRRCLGLADRGRIEPGRRADLVGLNSRNEVALTVTAGAIAYDAR